MRLSQNSLNALPARGGVLTSTFDERLDAAFELQTRVLNSDSFRTEFEDEMNTNLESLSQITGERPQRYRLPTGRHHPNLVKRRDDYIRKTDEKLAAHGLPTSEQARENVRKRQKEILDESEQTAARADGFDFAGMLGTMGGAFVDPINVTAMIVTAPIAVKSLPLFVLSEMAIGAGTETGIQVALRDDLKEIGFTDEQADEYALYSIGGAALAGGAFATLFRGVGKGVKAGFNRFRAKTAEDLVTRIQNGDEAALATLARLNQRTDLTPKEQAARDVLNRVADIAEDLPAGNRNPGTVAQYAMKLDAAADTINNSSVNVNLSVGEIPEIKLPTANRAALELLEANLEKKAVISTKQLESFDLTEAERDLLNRRLAEAATQRETRKAEDAGTGNQAERIERIKTKITEIIQSMPEEAYESYVRDIAKNTNIGKTKFADLTNIEKGAVRLAAGEDVQAKYDTLPKADKDAIDIEAVTIHDAIMKIRSENRIPSDAQIRKEVLQEIIGLRKKGIVEAQDAEQIKLNIESRGGYLNDLTKSLEDAYNVSSSTVGRTLNDINEQVAPDQFKLRNTDLPEDMKTEINEALKMPEGRSLEDIQTNAKAGAALTDNELVEAQMRLEVENADPDFLTIGMKEVDTNGNSTTKTVQEIIDEMDAEESAVNKIIACAS